MTRHLLKLGYLFYIVLVCSEPQQVFKYGIFKIIILSSYFKSIIPTRLMKLDATVYFQCAKDGVKVLSNTLESDILQKTICFYAENKTRV